MKVFCFDTVMVEIVAKIEEWVRCQEKCSLVMFALHSLSLSLSRYSNIIQFGFGCSLLIKGA